MVLILTTWVVNHLVVLNQNNKLLYIHFFHHARSLESDRRKWGRPHQDFWLGKTCMTGLDWTGLCWCVRTAAAAIESKLKSHCRVFVSLTGLHWTRLDSVGVYAPVRFGRHGFEPINRWMPRLICAVHEHSILTPRRPMRCHFKQHYVAAVWERIARLLCVMRNVQIY